MYSYPYNRHFAHKIFDIIKAIIEPNNKNIPKKIKRKTRRFKLLNAILYYKKFTPPKNFVPILILLNL
ncbi:Uncharacterized protein FWK35_00026462 [Aphis craccivora]|uniref:Uncharacterized protein n=1 Tax=Aphis craccivora TaxID=307492 RepID=A0A6G0WVK0_APHCR|nr:Uncharacterized protein FWK35_00026462 [Aphis craccivora]